MTEIKRNTFSWCQCCSLQLDSYLIEWRLKSETRSIMVYRVEFLASVIILIQNRANLPTMKHCECFSKLSCTFFFHLQQKNMVLHPTIKDRQLCYPACLWDQGHGKKWRQQSNPGPCSCTHGRGKQKVWLVFHMTTPTSHPSPRAPRTT